ncbi:MAG: ABC transporter ATP-binding protein [Bacteroidales bacterium]|nr:ABC transporter ATP-binding protein [Bacteroidales bacterium]
MLDLQNISKQLDGFSIRNISFKVEKGDYYIVLGHSGAGKTVLLEIIAGLITPDSGKVFYNGKDITFQKIQKRKFGLVFQDHAIFPHLSVKENIAYPLKSKKLSKKKINNTVIELAENFEITHLLNRKPANLSGGELQRIALARTLALDPDILLLDEPLSSLDVQLKNDLRRLLRSLNKNGQTIIHVTHDYEEAILLSNKIAVFHAGKIIQSGLTNDVFHHPGSEFVAHFTGIKNYFKVTLKDIEQNGLKTAIINDVEIKLLSTEKSKEGFIIIRCEDIILSDELQNSSAANNFKGIITEINPSKPGIEIVVDIGINLTALISEVSLHKLNLTEGKKICVSFKASAVKYIA